MKMEKNAISRNLLISLHKKLIYSELKYRASNPILLNPKLLSELTFQGNCYKISKVSSLNSLKG